MKWTIYYENFRQKRGKKEVKTNRPLKMTAFFPSLVASVGKKQKLGAKKSVYRF
jgi:hypothetical protein